jgi:glycosyltransferase involved in cell wall biosynthesis
MPDLDQVTVVIPAKNEALGLGQLLPRLRELHPDLDILVVDDGSDDETCATAHAHGARVVSHQYSMGNGAAIKTGVRQCDRKYLMFMDADFQHDPNDVAAVLERLDEGHDLVVGARDSSGQASLGRALANGFYNRLASWMVGHKVHDLTSGFRAVHRKRFAAFLHLLPNGFSYPATSTMAFFRAGHSVAYQPIAAQRRRGGQSHIRPVHDGLRFALIIFRIGTLYSPLKLFIPVSLMFFFSGIGYYFYTFIVAHRFTNMSALLLSTSVIIFLIGLVSEQITSLIYRDTGH